MEYSKSTSPRLTTVSAIVLALASMLVSLASIELAVYFKPTLIPRLVRSSYFQPEPEDYSPGTFLHEEVGYAYAPKLTNYEVPFGEDSYSISTVSLGYDNIGFRDDGLETEPFAIVLGDSFVACVGVEMEECWVEKLEKEMGKDFANLGVSGYGPFLQQRMLSKYGIPLNPKLVVWVFFANDLIQAWEYNQFAQGTIGQGDFWNNPIKSWLAKNSAIFLTASYVWYQRNFLYNLYFSDEVVSQDASLAWWLAHGDLNNPEVASGTKLTQEVIYRVHKQMQASLPDAQFIVVILPFREQFAYADSQFQPLLDKPNQEMMRFFQKNHISVIDLTPAFKSRGNSEAITFYFEDDSHLSKPGNAFVAQVLAQKLAEIVNR